MQRKSVRRQPSGRPVERNSSAFVTPSMWIIFLLLSVFPITRADDALALEYKVKAAYLFNFAKFIEWPASAFTNENAPLVIGVIDSGDAAGIIDGTLRGKSINSHPLLIKPLSAPD